MARTKAHIDSSLNRGFSLLELLAVIAVIGVLLAIALPALGRIRARSVELQCTVHLRSVATAITAYAQDYRGYVPYGGLSQHPINTPYGGQIPVGGVHGLSDGRWSSLLPEYWTGDRWPEGMVCPNQPEYDPASPGSPDSGSLMIDAIRREPFYELGAAFHLSATSLGNPIDSLEDPPVQVQAHKLDDVRYPSSKALLFEQFGFCIPQTQQSIPWMFDIQQTQLFPTSTVTVDGSGLRYARRNAYRPAHGLGLNYTMNGVLGRDVDRALENRDAFARLYGATWGEPPDE